MKAVATNHDGTNGKNARNGKNTHERRDDDAAALSLADAGGGVLMDYEARRRAMEREYEEAWERLSPAMREKLARVGIDGPDLMEEPARDLCREDDAEALFRNSTKLSVLADMAGEVDRLPWLMREAFGISEEQSEKIAVWHREAVQYEVKREVSLQLNRVIGFFLQPGNLLVRAHALAHAARMAAISGLRSLRHSSEVCKVSVEAVRKVAWKWVELLKLPPLEGAKSDQAREKYRQDKQTNHWRSQTCSAANLTNL